MREMMTYIGYILFSFHFFSGWAGGVGGGGAVTGFLFVLLGDDVYVLARPCSKCLQTWTLWLYSRFPSCHSRWSGLSGRLASWSSLSESWGNAVLLTFGFLGGFNFRGGRDLTRVYLFENKICDSVTIWMCLLFCFKAVEISRTNLVRALVGASLSTDRTCKGGPTRTGSKLLFNT